MERLLLRVRSSPSASARRRQLSALAVAATARAADGTAFGGKAATPMTSAMKQHRGLASAPPPPPPGALLLATARRATTTPPSNNKVAISAFSSFAGPTSPAMMAGEVADRCNINLVHSPFPPIPSGPYPPLYEFVSRHWKKPHHHQAPVGGEYLDGQVAIIDHSTGLQRTFRDYAVTTQCLGTALHDIIMKDEFDETNSTVAFFCPNHVDYLPTVLAITLMGAKVTPINPAYTQQELEPVLQRSRSCVLIVHTSVLETALKAANNCPLVKEIVVLTDDGSGREQVPEGTINYHSLVREYEHKSLHHYDNHQDDQPDQPLQPHPLLQETHPIVKATGTSYYACSLPYSSGTTGHPKGVCLTHANLVANLYQYENVEGMAFAPDHKLVSPLPFFHIYAFTVSLMYCGWKGHTLITMSDRFDLEELCKLIEEHKPQRAHFVPPILVGLAKHPIIDKYDLSSLRTIVCAAAPLGKDTESAVTQRLDHVLVKQAWGMSELSPIGTCNSDFNAVSGSIGPMVASTTGKIVDEIGKSLPPYQQGELAIKGPQVMLGYLDDPDKTAECLSPNGWLRTGDMAYFDEHGYCFITDRIKELIKVKGFQVAPAELEELLLSHPDVGDAAVIGIPDEKAGELPRAYVVLKSGHEGNVTEQDIVEWCKDQVAHYKQLKGGVEFIEEIPKAASGKILRKVLRAGFEQEK